MFAWVLVLSTAQNLGFSSVSASGVLWPWECRWSVASRGYGNNGVHEPDMELSFCFRSPMSHEFAYYTASGIGHRSVHVPAVVLWRDERQASGEDDGFII